MLYLLAEQLGFPGVLNLIRYITFRAGAATGTALLLGLVFGPAFINWLRRKQGKGQPIRADGPQSHLAKRGTPTMGGFLILLALCFSTLLWADLKNAYVWIVMLVTVGFGAVGFADDYLKLSKRNTKGLPGKLKLVWQIGISAIAAWLLVNIGKEPLATGLAVPFLKDLLIPLGILSLGDIAEDVSEELAGQVLGEIVEALLITDDHLL